MLASLVLCGGTFLFKGYKSCQIQLMAVEKELTLANVGAFSQVKPGEEITVCSLRCAYNMKDVGSCG